MCTHWTLTLCAVLCLYLSTFVEGDVCFRKYKDKKGLCKGPMRRDFTNARRCCNSKRGVGYAEKLEKQGRNLYQCEPCSRIRIKELQGDVVSGTADNKNKEASGWTRWGTCSVTCGAGWRSRARLCDGCDNDDPRNSQIQPCIVKYYCPAAGNWGPWYPWQPCSSSCGGGEQTRQRYCNYPSPSHGGDLCEGEAENGRECNVDGCPVNGNWGEWSTYSACSVSCRKGTITRTRLCNNPPPGNDGKPCPGIRYEQQMCSLRQCPLDGGWSLWGTWAACTAHCGSGSRRRYRGCDSPTPKHGGEQCRGADTDKQICYSGRPCPVDGGWNEWTSYSPCSAVQCSGDRGFRVRTRRCTEPQPRYGGKFCKGALFSTVECVNEAGCAANGSWCEWSDWSACHVTCRMASTHHIAFRRRERICECPSAQNGGLKCDVDGSTGFEVVKCDDLPLCQQEAPQRKIHVRVISNKCVTGDDSCLQKIDATNDDDKMLETASGDG